MTKTSPEHAAVPDWLLERFRVAELPLDQLADVRAVLDREPAARERLAQLDADSAAILDAHPPRLVGAAIRERLAAQPPGRPSAGAAWRPAFAVAVPTLVAVIGLALWSRQGLRPAPPDATQIAASGPSDTTRIKGLRPLLLAFRKDGEAAAPLSAGDAVRRGDVVQLAYQAAGHDFGAILSVDGRGVLTQHLPRAGDAAAPLQKDGPVALDSAYRLDDAPRFEVFYFVTADEPFDLAPVLAAAQAARAGADHLPAAALKLPSTFTQASFFLRKDASR